MSVCDGVCIRTHIGGHEKIMLAAGADIGPFWSIYRQHYNSPAPMQLLDKMKIGTLHADDLAKETALAEAADDNDPYANDPDLSPLLTYLSTTPINAESPSNLLANHFITPIPLW